MLDGCGESREAHANCSAGRYQQATIYQFRKPNGACILWGPLGWSLLCSNSLADSPSHNRALQHICVLHVVANEPRTPDRHEIKIVGLILGDSEG
jgi:hypothetical protein